MIAQSNPGTEEGRTANQGTEGQVRPASRKREQYTRTEAHANEGSSTSHESPGALQNQNGSNNAGTMISRGQRFLNQQK